MVTLHAVQPHFTPTQASVLEELCGHAAAVRLHGHRSPADARAGARRGPLAARRAHGAPVQLYQGRNVTRLGIASRGMRAGTSGCTLRGEPHTHRSSFRRPFGLHITS